MLKADLFLFLSYLWVNPYRHLRKFLQKKGVENPYQYGETPLKIIETLIDAAGGLKEYQYFADLGAGRGRLSYFVQKKYQCKVFAFEQLALFVNKGKKLYPNVEFILGNFLDKELFSIDLIYLYGTMMSEDEILSFVKKIKGNTKIITISYPLSDYDSRFMVLKKVDVHFPWGKTFGYIQCLRK
jgi:hypothetical protein